MIATRKATEDDVFLLLGKMKKIREDVDKKLSSYFQDSKNDEIKLDELNGIKVGDKIQFDKSDKNFAELICITNEKLTFIVISDDNIEIHKHKHNFDKKLKVIKGSLYETVSKKMYITNDSINIRPFQAHGFKVDESSIFIAIINLL